jgi:ATP-dependent Clp protease, protease subunit
MARTRETELTFSGKITAGTSESLRMDVERAAHEGIESVHLAVSTDGGEVASAMKLYFDLGAMKPELVTHAAGGVASMGIVLFLAGDRRLASPDATFLMHPIRIEAPAGWETTARWLDLDDLSNLRTRAEGLALPTKRLVELDWGIARLGREEQEVRTVVEQRTTLTGPDIRALVRHGKPVDAAFARSVGIVHEIVAAGA